MFIMGLKILLLLVITSVNSSKTDNNNNKVFIPTKEWKVIGEGNSIDVSGVIPEIRNNFIKKNLAGQPIPPGLHVRINLQTGKKEAKLLDADEKTDEKSSAMVMSPISQEDTKQEDPESIHSRLKDALKNIPDEGIEYTEEKLKEITKKFRSYESIKEEFKEMNMKIKSDFQLMSDLFERYEKIKSDYDLNNFRNLFEDLEYLLHQIDNANDFVTAGGFEKVILPNLSNQTIPELRMHSVKLLGILVQNNPKAQISAFEKNVGSILLQMLAQSTSISTNELSSVVFAFGGLLRKFPLAQEELLNNPGLKILVDLLGKRVDYKIKMKCLLLINDLIGEYDEVTGNDDFNKTKQYNATDIKNRLLTTDYCTNMVEIMTTHRQDYLESLYVADEILNVLLASKDICRSKWSKSSTFQNALLAIKISYDQKKNQTNFDEFELHEVVDKLELLQTFSSNRTTVNDEL